MPLTVGTAGHIDHGKTWLVRALTGKDTDRLPEEKARGISIELGYAPLELPDRRRLSLVDVPGHERFVRTMVAGATGIDLFLLVIDAREGARAQTHEHLAVLRLLDVEIGVVAVTKADAVDSETVALAVDEARTLVPGADVVAVSAKTGSGLDELRAALARAADRIPERSAVAAATRLYVDRAFTLRGIGTVVTGTLWSGAIAAGDPLRLEPRGVDVRVRSVHVHDRPVERADAGQRVALNLPGVAARDVRRGDAIVTPDAFTKSYRLDVTLESVARVPDRATLHHGTTHVSARVVLANDTDAQLRLVAPVVAARGDRFVLRTHTTVGGGTVVDPAPPRGLDPVRFARVATGDAAALVHEPVPARELELRGLDTSSLARADGWTFSQAWLDDLAADLRERIAAADALDPGIPPPSEPWAEAVVALLGLERRGAKLYIPGAKATLDGRHDAAVQLEREVEDAGLEPVRVDDRQLARHLEDEGRLVRVGDGLAVGRDAYERARTVLVEECTRAGSITLARFRDVLGISRRPAQLLLERFDADGVTRRVGDARVLRRRARAG